MLIKRFKTSIDFPKFIKYVVDETGAGKAQARSERKALALGRLFILSAILEAGVFLKTKKTKEVLLEELAKTFFYELTRLWNQQPHFRASIMKVIEKALDVLSTQFPNAFQSSIQELSYHILMKPTEEVSKPIDVLKFRVSTNPDYLSLYLVCKEGLKKFDSEPTNETLKSISSWSIKDDYKYVFEQMKTMEVDETSASAFRKLIQHLISLKANKCIKYMWKNFFEKFCFNESLLYEKNLNKKLKISLNNIGFNAFIEFIDSDLNPETIISFLTPNFVRMWISRIHKKRKNKLPAALQMDEKFKTWLETHSKSISNEVKLDIIKNLFGPNAQRRFTLKSNLTLFTLIAQDLPEEAIQEFIIYAQDMFKTPDLELFYPEAHEGSSSEEDQDDAEKLKHNKEDNIKIYTLNLLANTVLTFKNHTESTLTEITNFIVFQAYFSSDNSDKMKEFSKDKLFTLVDGLHRRKSNVEFKEDIVDKSLGVGFTNTFLESKSLWLSEVNKTIGRYAAEGNQFNNLDAIDTEDKKPKKVKQEENKHDMKVGKFSYLVHS